jgi:hypothetical protein
VFAQLPGSARAGDGGRPHSDALLLRAMIAGMAPAQARCLTLMFEQWRKVSS